MFYLGLGTGLVTLGQWSEAVGMLHGMSLGAEADFYLAEAKFGQKQWSEAVEFDRRSWEVNPGRVDCCIGWAKALGKLGQWEKAVELYPTFRRSLYLFMYIYIYEKPSL